MRRMKAEETRFVWVFVFFDLPVGTKPQRTAANRFRNFLKDDGFIMLQFSVYARICRADEGAQKHLERVKKNLPARGSVRALQVTDKQYDRMKFMLGEAGKSERAAVQQLVLL
jgi:CRISPR-associated protein Cas2